MQGGCCWRGRCAGSLPFFRRWLPFCPGVFFFYIFLLYLLFNGHRFTATDVRIQVGKTSLLITYSTKQFPKDYIPSGSSGSVYALNYYYAVFDMYEKILKVADREVQISLWDTTNRSGLINRLTILTLPKTNVWCPHLS